MPFPVVFRRLALEMEAPAAFRIFAFDGRLLNRCVTWWCLLVRVCRQHFHAAVGVVAHDSNILTSVFGVIMILHHALPYNVSASWVVAFLSLSA